MPLAGPNGPLYNPATNQPLYGTPAGTPGARLVNATTGKRLLDPVTGKRLLRAAAPEAAVTIADRGEPARSWRFPVKTNDGAAVADADARAELFPDGTLRFTVTGRGRLLHFAESPGYDLDARPPLQCRVTGKTLRIEFDLSRPSPLPVESEAR
jgi:hypothetical protein